MYEDITLTCKECGQEFVFTAGEQENQPKMCKACRAAKKSAGQAKKEMFTCVCANCGGEAKVPFQPSNDRPVYCSACYAAMRQQ